VNRRKLRWVGRVLALLALAVWFAALRPQWLGGPAMYLMVRGDSMLPTYQNGDLLVIMRHDAYSVGDAAAYRVPADEVGAGRIVVHRVTEIEKGRFTMQGDNNPAPDPARPEGQDMVGTVVLQVPGFGAVIATILSPTVAGGLAAALVVMYGVARLSAPTTKQAQASAIASD